MYSESLSKPRLNALYSEELSATFESGQRTKIVERSGQVLRVVGLSPYAGSTAQGPLQPLSALSPSWQVITTPLYQQRTIIAALTMDFYSTKCTMAGVNMVRYQHLPRLRTAVDVQTKGASGSYLCLRGIAGTNSLLFWGPYCLLYIILVFLHSLLQYTVRASNGS